MNQEVMVNLDQKRHDIAKKKKRIPVKCRQRNKMIPIFMVGVSYLFEY